MAILRIVLSSQSLNFGIRWSSLRQSLTLSLIALAGRMLVGGDENVGLSLHLAWAQHHKNEW